jgi:hypothetical protein
MPWTTPKTDWETNPTNPLPSDFNRIEGNIDFLNTDIETKKGLVVDALSSVGIAALIADTHVQIASKITGAKKTGINIIPGTLNKEIPKGIYDTGGGVVEGDANLIGVNIKPGVSIFGVAGSIPSKGAAIITPGTANQIIASGQYLTGDQTIAGDPDLISSNIKAGANIFGVVGNSNVVDTSAGTAVAADILSGKVAFVDGAQVNGSMVDRGTVNQTLSTQGQQYTILAGKHSGSGKVTASFANLSANNIKNSVNIGGVVGNLIPAPSFLATQITSKLDVTNYPQRMYADSSTPESAAQVISFAYAYTQVVLTAGSSRTWTITATTPIAIRDGSKYINLAAGEVYSYGPYSSTYYIQIYNPLQGTVTVNNGVAYGTTGVKVYKFIS